MSQKRQVEISEILQAGDAGRKMLALLGSLGVGLSATTVGVLGSKDKTGQIVQFESDDIEIIKYKNGYATNDIFYASAVSLTDAIQGHFNTVAQRDVVLEARQKLTKQTIAAVRATGSGEFEPVMRVKNV
jgi:hypothetical protein